MNKKVVIIIGILIALAILFVGVILLAGLLWFGWTTMSFDYSDQIGTNDATVSTADLDRITSHLLNTIPKIREEKTRLISEGNPQVKLSVNILNAPDPTHTRNDPDYRYHAEYYWIYVSYSTETGLLKYETYLVHKDLADIYIVDAIEDKFIKITG